MKHPNARIEGLLTALANPNLGVIDLSLARIERLLLALGSPHDRLPPVIHVAGTNGKGSLLAYLTAIFEAAGLRVHRYLSPHLVRFNERIMLAGQDISDAALLPLLERVAAQAGLHPVTFFEATTAAAFLAFAETPADIVLLETGLGGRLDATNMIHSPLLTAITPISIDHVEYLGNTLPLIAAEKAGIIKTNVPLVVGPQPQEAQYVIERIANIAHAPLYRFDQEWIVKPDQNGFYYCSSRRNDVFPLPSLEGEHQRANAATAIACVDAMEGFVITAQHINFGITHATWPARLQRLKTGNLAALLPANSELWLDGGHNPGAGAVIAAWVKSQQKPVHLICGMLSNKDVRQFLLPLSPFVRSLAAIPIEGEPGGQNAEHIYNIAHQLGIGSTLRINIKNAIEAIVTEDKNDFIILICGSLYLAGNILWQNSLMP